MTANEPRGRRVGNTRRVGGRGITLIELVVVLVILAAVAGLVVPLVAGGVAVPMGDRTVTPDELATRATMQTLHNAIVGSPSQAGYIADVGELPAASTAAVAAGLTSERRPWLRYLFVNPQRFADASTLESNEPTFDRRTARGWRGPYLSPRGSLYQTRSADGFDDRFGKPGDPTVLDAWGRPIVIAADRDADATAELNRWHVRSAGEDRVLFTEDDVTLTLPPTARLEGQP